MSEKNQNTNTVTIVTHSGQFHMDDVLAVVTLRLVLEKDFSVIVIRTRDENIINSADYVVDVGGVYDPLKKRFDHHQSDGAGCRVDGIPYASFGLVWKEYGESITGDKSVADSIEDKIVRPVDAMDNGMDVSPSGGSGVIKMYDIKDINRAFVATWKEDSSILDINFKFLTDVFMKILEREIQVIKDIREGEDEVLNIISSNKYKTLLILDKHLPYERLLFSKEYILLVVSPKRQDNTWSVKTVRNSFDSYQARIDLPAQWAGKMGEELVSVTGVSDAIFCHRGRFIAVAKSKEGAIKLAELALKEVEANL